MHAQLYLLRSVGDSILPQGLYGRLYADVKSKFSLRVYQNVLPMLVHWRALCAEASLKQLNTFETYYLIDRLKRSAYPIRLQVTRANLFYWAKKIFQGGNLVT